MYFPPGRAGPSGQAGLANPFPELDGGLPAAAGGPGEGGAGADGPREGEAAAPAGPAGEETWEVAAQGEEEGPAVAGGQVLGEVGAKRTSWGGVVGSNGRSGRR